MIEEKEGVVNSVFCCHDCEKVTHSLHKKENEEVLKLGKNHLISIKKL